MNRSAICSAVLVLAAALASQQESAAPAPTPALRAEWRAIQQRLADPQQAMVAAVELLHRGREGVPILAALLVSDWPEPAKELEGLRLCVRILDELGPEAAGALDALVASLGTTKLKDQYGPKVLRAIGHIAPYHRELRETVAKDLGSNCDKHAYFGIDEFFATMSRLQFEATAPLSELLAGLAHKNPYVRELAAEAIARSVRSSPPEGKLREQALEQLLTALTEDGPAEFNLTWLWNGGQATTSGTAANSKEIRTAVSGAIAELAPERPEALNGHLENLQRLDPLVVGRAARAIGMLGADAAAAVPQLARLLQQDVRAAREAATALGMIGPAARSAIAELEAAAKSPDKQLAGRAQASLKRLRE